MLYSNCSYSYNVGWIMVKLCKALATVYVLLYHQTFSQLDYLLYKVFGCRLYTPPACCYDTTDIWGSSIKLHFKEFMLIFKGYQWLTNLFAAAGYLVEKILNSLYLF